MTADCSLHGAAICALHDAMLQGARRLDQGEADAWHWIAENHRQNSMLWDEEDCARRTDVADAEIAGCKRRIDRHNQQRNDAMEKIDERLLATLPAVRGGSRARQHSETPGMMIDRLSILALKIFHMREQAERRGASAGHVARCAAKLASLVEQRGDLVRCLDDLLYEARQGSAFFKVYRQHKMYNDPALNPYLSGLRPSGAGFRRAAG